MLGLLGRAHGLLNLSLLLDFPFLGPALVNAIVRECYHEVEASEVLRVQLVCGLRLRNWVRHILLYFWFRLWVYFLWNTIQAVGSMIKWRLSLRTKNSLIESLGACAVVWHDVVRGVQSIAYRRLHRRYLTAVKVISCVYVGHAATVRCMLWVYFIFPLFPLSVGHAVFFGRICIWTAALAPLLRGHRWMTLPHYADPLLLLIVLVKEGPPVHSTGHLIGV